MSNTPFDDEVDLDKTNIGNNPVIEYDKKVIAFNKERVKHETVNGVISILGAVGGLCINLFIPERLLTLFGLRPKQETKGNSSFNIDGYTLIQIAMGLARMYIGYILLFGCVAPLIPFGKIIIIVILLTGVIKEYRNTEAYNNKKQNKPDKFEQRYQQLVEEGKVMAQKEQEWLNAIQNQRQGQTQSTNPDTSSSTEDPFNTFYDGSDNAQ